LRLKRSNIGTSARGGSDGRRAGKLEFYAPAFARTLRHYRVAATHRVRIIGGRHRGRQIPVPGIPGLRPTPDRVRETLFNWLGQDLSGATTLDLYAGTGALTLEAQSRGAALSVAIDRNAALIRALANTAAAIGAAGLETRVGDALRYLAHESRVFDVVFCDPPFADDPWQALFAALPARVATGGRVYAEAGRRLEPAPPWQLLRHGRAGQVHYHLLAVTPNPVAKP
jgi:16S rRNA (guanine966-N2)-methyltransferase